MSPRHGTNRRNSTKQNGFHSHPSPGGWSRISPGYVWCSPCSSSSFSFSTQSSLECALEQSTVIKVLKLGLFIVIPTLPSQKSNNKIRTEENRPQVRLSFINGLWDASSSPERRLGRLDYRHCTALFQQSPTIVVVVRHVPVLARILVAHLVLWPQQRCNLVWMMIVCNCFSIDYSHLPPGVLFILFALTILL